MSRQFDDPPLYVVENGHLRTENERLREEIKEARNEASVVRRAYLHERQRANVAVRTLREVGARTEADELDEQAYKGAAERYCTGQST
jgi:regulator of replication initiation timing